MADTPATPSRTGSITAASRVVLPLGVVLVFLAAIAGIWMRDAALPRIERVEKSNEGIGKDVTDHEKRLQVLETRVPLQLDQVKEDAARTRRVVEEMARRQGVIVP